MLLFKDSLETVPVRVLSAHPECRRQTARPPVSHKWMTTCCMECLYMRGLPRAECRLFIDGLRWHSVTDA